MKKVIMILVCLMTMVMISSCGNIEEDGNAAIEKYEKWSKECVKSYAESHAEEVGFQLREYAKTSKKIDRKGQFEKYYKDVENDANSIVHKCFDPLFDKYGERKVIEWVNNKASEKSYNAVEFNSKEELYEHFKDVIGINYSKLYKINLDIKVSELKLEMIRNRW